MHIKGKLVTLRAPEPRDAELLNRWANDPDLWDSLLGWHFPYAMASTLRWIADRSEPNPKHQVWCIDVPDLGVVGTTTLELIDWKNRHAFLGMMLGDAATRGKGYALDATLATLRFAFKELGLHRIEGHVLAFNARSLGLYVDKVGFKVEGRRREAYFRGGAFHDAVVLGITDADYRERMAKTRYWETPAAGSPAAPGKP